MEHSLSLSPLERLMIFGLLPEVADFITHKRSNDLRARLSFTDEEVKAWRYRVEDGQHKWENFELDGSGEPDLSKPINQDAEIYIGEIMWDRIAKMLKEKNANETLGANEVSLYEKFVEKTESPATNGKFGVLEKEFAPTSG